MGDVIQNIADQIVSEANHVKGNDLCGAIYHIHHLVRLKLMEMADEIRQAERAWRLKKEIIDDN